MIADLGNRRRLHIAGKNFGIETPYALVFLKAYEKLVSGANQPCKQLPFRELHPRSLIQQKAVSFEIPRAAFYYTEGIGRAAPYVVIGAARGDDHIPYPDFRPHTAGAARIDDAVGPELQYHFGCAAGGIDFAYARQGGLNAAGAKREKLAFHCHYYSCLHTYLSFASI